MTVGSLGLVRNHHEVGQLDDPVGTKRPRNENIRLRPVELLGVGLANPGRNTELSAPILVKNAREDARRIEMRNAQPVDRPILTHEGRGLHVSNQSVVFYRLVHGQVPDLLTLSVRQYRLHMPASRCYVTGLLPTQPVALSLETASTFPSTSVAGPDSALFMISFPAVIKSVDLGLDSPYSA